MDVRVLVARVTEGFQVTIIAIKPPVKGWSQIFPDKVRCIAGLERAGFLPPEEAAETLDDPFDEEHSMLVIWANTDTPTILSNGFLPTYPHDAAVA